MAAMDAAQVFVFSFLLATPAIVYAIGNTAAEVDLSPSDIKCELCAESSCESCDPARAAIDGDASTIWQSPSVVEGDTVRLTLDLGQVAHRSV